MFAYENNCVNIILEAACPQMEFDVFISSVRAMRVPDIFALYPLGISNESSQASFLPTAK